MLVRPIACTSRGIRSIIRQPAHRAEIMIGSGGTFTALAHMSKWQREGRHGSVQGYVLTPAEIIHLLRRLRETPLEARRQIPGLSPDRADIIVAGASNLLMSLWKVDDEATAQLMGDFYKNWNAKVSQSAFRNAQLELRRKFPDPYYWGAFIMLGR